jgi:hypothetical protein
MNARLIHILAQQRSAELKRAGEQARLSGERRTARRRAARVLQDGQEPRVTGFTLRGHHIGKLDRFVGQAQRTALRAEREFEGVRIEVDAQGVVSVHAIGMVPIVL